MAGEGSRVPSGAAEVYFELTRLGGQVRIAAIDARTGIEVIVVAPLSASQAQMQDLALAKLKRRVAQVTEK